MKFYENHRLLFGAALALFLGLTYLVAISPALKNQANNAPLPNTIPLTPDELAGKELYVANGCVACHTQQVRSIDMDKAWGSRPSIAADYARIGRMDAWRNTATLMGTERTGPDLTDIGRRQPSVDWHLLHLYNPRTVVESSIMPAYPWLFEVKREPEADDKVVAVPEAYQPDEGKVVAKKEALQLVDYLLSLKQTQLPTGAFATESPPTRAKPQPALSNQPNGANEPSIDGKAMYAKSCQACHQPNGEGLPGAFPTLKGSPIVLDQDPAKMISIIMNGYDGRVSEGFAVMPPIGSMNNLSAEEVHAIANYVRSSWGNDAPPATLEEVKAILDAN